MKLPKALKDLTKQDLQEMPSQDLLQQALDYVIENHPGNDDLKMRLLEINREARKAVHRDMIYIYWSTVDIQDRAWSLGFDKRVLPDDDAAREILHRVKLHSHHKIESYLNDYERQFISNIPKEELPLYMDVKWVWEREYFNCRLRGDTNNGGPYAS